MTSCLFGSAIFNQLLHHFHFNLGINVKVFLSQRIMLHDVINVEKKNFSDTVLTPFFCVILKLNKSEEITSLRDFLS